MLTKNTYSQVSVKVAAAVITAVIIGLGSLGFVKVDEKVSQEQLEIHCSHNERDFQQLKWELGAQRSTVAKQEKVIEAQEAEIKDLKSIMQSIDGKFNLIMFRLESIEKKIDKQ
jgi:uncharacterized protein HemX